MARYASQKSIDDDFTQSTVKLFGVVVQLYGTANLSQQ